jgi:hypothetical protein
MLLGMTPGEHRESPTDDADAHLRALAVRADLPEYRVRSVDDTVQAIVLASERDEQIVGWSHDRKSATKIAHSLNWSEGL